MLNRYLKAFYGEKNTKKNVFFMLVYFLEGFFFFFANP